MRFFKRSGSSQDLGRFSFGLRLRRSVGEGSHKQLEGAADPAAPSVLFRIPRGTQLLWTITPPVLTMLPAGMAPRTQETG